MIRRILTLAFLFSCHMVLYPQGEGGVFTQSRLAALKTGEGSLGNNPAGIEWFNELRRKTAVLGEFEKVGLEDIEGSVYLNESFAKGKVFYNNEFYQTFLLRYDAYNDEVEIKRGTTESLQALHKSFAISCEISGDVLEYIAFIEKNNEVKKGYLFRVFKGKHYSLFKRRFKIFKEAKPAKTSLQASFPHRFVYETRYFLQKGMQNPSYLKLKKSNLFQKLDESLNQKIKSFIKENDIDLNNEAELLQLISFANSIASD